ncbi:GAF domain-containing protein [Candidatus Uabimicrobium sp. HlEnr_7]|uniref:GAF domain-containing protein n=1 Tax=Candidatus Uabimicrobium helgolandensis TaxID=3095367 RepID=UPI003556BF0E
MAQIIIISAPDAEMENKCFTIVGKVTIGRSPSNTIVLSSGSISPYHVSLEITNNEFWIENISQNKQLFVNDVQQKKIRIQHGDIITIGSCILLFDDQETLENTPAVVDEKMQSRIESRQKHYDSAQHVLQSLGNIDKSHGRLVVLYKVSNAISGILDLDQVLQKFLDIILEEFPADRAFILLYDEMKKNLQPVAVHNNSKNKEDTNAKISQSILNEVLQTRESLLCENIMKDIRFKEKDSLVNQNVTSAICVPLLRKEDILGIIYLDSDRENLFMPSDLDLLTKIALQASVVIENARLYKAHQKFNEDLISLSHATQNLSSSLEEKTIINYAVEYASQILSCEKSFLILREDDGYQLCSSIGIPSELHGKFEIPGELYGVINENKSIITNNINDVYPELQALQQKKLLGDTFIIVPVVSSLQNNVQTKTMGLLGIGNKKNNELFKNEDMQILTILAGYTAVGLTNAQLYQDLQKKEEEIARWNQELEERVVERTERIKSMQDKLIHSEKMAAVGLLAAGVSHEFNNIIASMYGFSQIAKKNDKYKDRLVDIVIEQSQRACEITESLLSFSKQRGDVEELVKVESTIEALLKLIKPALEKEDIKVIKDFQDTTKTYTIPDKLEQVFLHLMINARDAIEGDGVITIKTWEQDAKIYTSITDNGRGIESENCAKVFEPFYTTKGSFGSGTQPGMGTGLSVCYNIVKSLKGDISLQSELQKGTTVTMILPVNKERGRNTTTRRIKYYVGRSVVVLEREDETRDLLSTIIEEQGFNVFSVTEGRETLELCEEKAIDIVFLDINIYSELAKENFDLVQKIRDISSKIKIIFLSGRAEDANVLEYVKKADGYVRKPFDINDIHRIIKFKE